MKLNERQQREQAYYDQYAMIKTQSEVDLSPVEGQSFRPWNSYWLVYQRAMELRDEAPQRLLDFGCGSGENSIRFAHLGYEIHGFDVSQNNIEAANQLAAQFNYSPTPSYTLQVAEKLAYPDDFFDVIIGIDILHHVDIVKSIRECLRVLKPGGTAIFREPIENPFFDTIRNTALVKKFFPKEASFDLHITEDERKLTNQDIESIRAAAPNMKIDWYCMLARASRVLKGPMEFLNIYVEKTDYYAIRHAPFLGKLGAGSAVIQIQK